MEEFVFLLLLLFFLAIIILVGIIRWVFLVSDRKQLLIEIRDELRKLTDKFTKTDPPKKEPVVQNSTMQCSNCKCVIPSPEETCLVKNQIVCTECKERLQVETEVKKAKICDACKVVIPTSATAYSYKKYTVCSKCNARLKAKAARINPAGRS